MIQRSPPLGVALPNRPTALSVQVPVQFLHMLAEMWGQVKSGQERSEQAPALSSMHADLEKSLDDLEHVSVGSRSTCLSSGSNLSSPDCCTPASSPGLSSGYCCLSPSDKAQLIEDLKKAICASSPPNATTLSPLLRPYMRNPSSSSIPAAISPCLIPAGAAPQPPRCVSLAPAQLRTALPAGRIAWQPIMLTTIHHAHGAL